MNKYMSYEDLDVFRLAKELAIQVHKMTLQELPKFEMYETGSQIRRSSKSIASNIVEGYGRRKSKNDFVLFLTYAIASCDETKVHLDLLFGTGSLGGDTYNPLLASYKELGAKLYNFRDAVKNNHRTS